MDDQPTERQAGGTRGGDGKFTRTPETAERDARAAELRGRGWSYRKIAAELDLTVSNAHAAVQRALQATVAEAAAEVRQIELERLDRLYKAAVKVLERDHITVSQGHIIRTRVLDDDGNPIVLGYKGNGEPIYKERDLLDDGPTLKAVETLLKIQARRAALLGLDAEKKVSVSGGVKYEVVGIDVNDLT